MNNVVEIKIYLAGRVGHACRQTGRLAGWLAGESQARPGQHPFFFVYL